MNTNNNEKLDITRVLNLSTAHITKNTADTLGRCALNNDYIPLCGVFEKSEYGWYVYIDSDDPNLIPDELSDIRDCVIFALKHDINCICFDRDADIAIGLPVYDWKDSELKEYYVSFCGSYRTYAYDEDEASEKLNNINLDNDIEIDDVNVYPIIDGEIKWS